MSVLILSYMCLMLLHALPVLLGTIIVLDALAKETEKVVFETLCKIENRDFLKLFKL